MCKLIVLAALALVIASVNALPKPQEVDIQVDDYSQNGQGGVDITNGMSL